MILQVNGINSNMRCIEMPETGGVYVKSSDKQ